MNYVMIVSFHMQLYFKFASLSLQIYLKALIIDLFKKKVKQAGSILKYK